jgi:hypothetical protein
MHIELSRIVHAWQPVTIQMANGADRLVTQQVIRRFAEKVEVSTDGCWQWTAGLFPAGYGSFKVRGIGVGAHRFSYLAFCGPIPAGLCLDHQCHTMAIERGECEGGASCLHRRCVNPSHLKPVTPRENVLASLSWAAEHAKRTTCVNGHELEGDTLYLRPTGGRACYQCHRELDRRQRREKAAREGRKILPLPADRTHCPQGHPYDEANTGHSRGQRVCRACAAARSREYQARKKAERDRRNGK